MRGTLTATSKLLNLDHSPCSPRDQPEKMILLTGITFNVPTNQKFSYHGPPEEL